MKLHQVLLRRRKDLKMKQYQLAEAMNINPAYLSQIECGKKPLNINLLPSFAKALRTQVSSIVFEAYGKKEDRKLFIKVQPLFEELLSILLIQ